MSKKSAITNQRLRERFARLHEGEERYCSSCRQTKNALDFWDRRTHKAMKTCSRCLKEQRAAAAEVRRNSPTPMRHPIVKRLPHQALRAAAPVTKPVAKTKVKKVKPPTIKPVAMTPSARRQRYYDYITSAAWAAKKAEYWEHGEHKACYVCGRERHIGMEMHHRTYIRFTHEDLDDLVPVCRGCHEKITRLYKANKHNPKTKRLSLWESTDRVRDEATPWAPEQQRRVPSDALSQSDPFEFNQAV